MSKRIRLDTSDSEVCEVHLRKLEAGQEPRGSLGKQVVSFSVGDGVRITNQRQNMSEYYGIMHMAQSLVRLLSAWGQGRLPSLSEVLVTDLIPRCLLQALVRTLQQQNADGSWGVIHSAEETAYAIIALSNICSATIFSKDAVRVSLAVQRGKRFLSKSTPTENPDRVWTGKVFHGISYVREAYILAALKVESKNFIIN